MWKETDTCGGPDFTFNRTSSQKALYLRTHGRFCHLSRCVILGFATGMMAIFHTSVLRSSTNGNPLLAWFAGNHRSCCSPNLRLLRYDCFQVHAQTLRRKVPYLSNYHCDAPCVSVESRQIRSTSNYHIPQKLILEDKNCIFLYIQIHPARDGPITETSNAVHAPRIPASFHPLTVFKDRTGPAVRIHPALL